jgi:hypothetical protein
MGSHITEIALAATLATALISAAPALALSAGHNLANHTRTKLNHNYHCGLSQRSGYQWDPWDTGAVTTVP